MTDQKKPEEKKSRILSLDPKEALLKLSSDLDHALDRYEAAMLTGEVRSDQHLVRTNAACTTLFSKILRTQARAFNAQITAVGIAAGVIETEPALHELGRKH